MDEFSDKVNRLLEESNKRSIAAKQDSQLFADLNSIITRLSQEINTKSKRIEILENQVENLEKELSKVSQK